ncbi:MAG: ATP-binding protein [Myxococcota bacterium]|nr:ATP-binding protein [Myxococcota bacterium]
MIGPRQVGKTTLAHVLGDGRGALYLDLESREDRGKLSEPAGGAPRRRHQLGRLRHRKLLAVAASRTVATFYRTAAGAEVDLVLDLPKGDRWAIEIKRGLTARPEKGFRVACRDLAPARRFVVYSGEARFPVSPEIEGIGVRAMAGALAGAA